MATVLIVGCGVTGPVLALLLHKRGYKPIIVEKVQRLDDVGLSLGLYPNGMKVLSAAGIKPGGVQVFEILERSSDGECLRVVDLSYFEKEYGAIACGVRRSELSKTARDEAVRHSIPIHLGWELKDIVEMDDGITAVAKDGREIHASFLVGCDGLHSATRKWLLEKHGQTDLPADSTGLVIVGGISPTPPGVEKNRICTWYGEARFALTHQVEPAVSSWAIVTPAPDESESWQQETDVAEQSAILLQELDGWPQPLRALVANAQKLVKYGLYDRPELLPEQWFYNRCVLLGDASHPTSPHQGQGANQGLEDCWHLARELPEASGTLSIDELKNAFGKFAEKRQQVTAMMTKMSRVQGNIRVVSGQEACRKRNEAIRRIDPEDFRTRMHNILKEPF